MKLKIQLIPETTYGKNVRSNISTDSWQRISNVIRYQANGICSICGKENLDVCDMDAHEVWKYKTIKRKGKKTRIQSLYKIIPVCKLCHATIHLGFTTNRGGHEVAARHYMKVNQCGRKKFIKEEKQAYKKWRKRSKHNWIIDINTEYLNQILTTQVEI